MVYDEGDELLGRVKIGFISEILFAGNDRK
jgi:hypothetical protein